MITRNQARALCLLLHPEAELRYIQPDIDGNHKEFGFSVWAEGERKEAVNGPAARGLIARGLLSEVEPGRYVLTAEGDEVAHAVFSLGAERMEAEAA